MVDLIIPTVTGREATLERCLESYHRCTAKDVLTVIVIKDEETCGIAWKKGMALSNAPYVHLTCDDLEMRSETWAGVCCETVDEGFLPCPVIYRPNESIESCGGDTNSAGHLISTMQPDKTPCGFTVLPFMSREQADAIGMVDSHYKSDVYVSDKGRQLGYETVVRHGYELIHHRSDIKRRQPAPSDDQHYAAGMNA